MLHKISMFAVLVAAAVLSIPVPALAIDKCDITSLGAMNAYGEMRLEIRRVARPRNTLAPATHAMTLVDLYGCDMERVRAGIDCVEAGLAGTSEEQLIALVLDCGSRVGLETEPEKE